MAIFRDFNKVLGSGRRGSGANIHLSALVDVPDASECMKVNNPKIHLLPERPNPKYTLTRLFFVILARYLGQVAGGVAQIFS
jgi:hypothetical protein